MRSLFPCLIAFGALACALPEPEPVQGRGSVASELANYIADPAFEVIPAGGCGTVRGWLISETPEMRVFMDIEAEEREEAPVVAGAAIATPSNALDSAPLVENVIRWHMEGETDSASVSAYETRVDYKLRGLQGVRNGEVLVLGETGTGDSLLEFWVLSEPQGPGLDGPSWVPVERFTRALYVWDFDVDVRFSTEVEDPKPHAFSKIVWQQPIGGLPIAMDAFVPGGLVFVLSRDPATKATTLWKLDARKAWAKTQIQTSEEFPTLAASVELGVFPLGDGRGFLLMASGVGFSRETAEGVETRFVREVLCLEDGDGDGLFESEQVFEDQAAFLAYGRSLAGAEASKSAGAE